MLTSGLTAYRSTGATVFTPSSLSNLAMAYADLGQFEDAWRCIGEAMTAVEATKERWCEAEIYRIVGEIALLSPEQDAAKAQAYFERALAVAREQQAKSWELRAAMSMARLKRGQGKRDEARDLLAPVYGWFTEGFDTLDLREAKVLLDELHVGDEHGERREKGPRAPHALTDRIVGMQSASQCHKPLFLIAVGRVWDLCVLQ
jgi:predicted ATPase